MIHRKILYKYSSLSRKDRYILWAIFITLVILTVGVFRLTGNSVLDEITRESNIRKVSTEQVAVLSTETTPISIIGTVRSESEAVLKTETAGIITGVYRTAGDFVEAGTIIAEIKNEGEKAAVAQAQANLEKVQKGSRDEELSILLINLDNAEENLNSVKRQSINTLLSAYATSDDVITRSADQIVSNASTQNPQVNITITESQLETDIENIRIVVEDILSEFEIKRNSLSTNDDLSTEMISASEDVETIKNYLDTIVSALNNTERTESVSESDIETLKGDVSTARTGVLSSLSSLATQKQSLDDAISALEVAEKNYSKGITGGREEDVASSEAALRVAQANLEKTRVRTPISGRISSLSISTGAFVSQFDSAAIVSNSNALEILSYITESERNNIAVGNEALINSSFNGVITSIAPGLDPQTKKIEVRIGVVDSGALLTQGSSVETKVSRSRPASVDEVEEIFIPISALKIGTDDAFVFTVTPTNTLSAHLITIGRILGDKVEIVDGITPDMFIVTDARGLKEGQEVVTQ